MTEEHVQPAASGDDRAIVDHKKLEITPLLLAEFNYAATSASQAHEDRAKVSTFYVVTVGSLVAAIVGSQLGGPLDTSAGIAFSVLFGSLALAGFNTVLQLVRLRQAWRESALAMCKIKDYYVEHGVPSDSVRAFRWTAATVPPAYKPWSISFLLSLQVSALGSLSLGTATLLLGQALGFAWWIPATGVAIGFFVAQLLAFWSLLRG